MLTLSDNQQEPSIPSSGSYKKLTLEARTRRTVEQAFDDVVDHVTEDVVDCSLGLFVENLVIDTMQRMFDNSAGFAVRLQFLNPSQRSLARVSR
jgi:hypothetical protein